MFVQPKFQLKMSLYYIILGGLMLVGVGALVLNRLLAVRSLMNSGDVLDYQVQSQINELLVQSVQMTFIGFGVFILLSFIFALLVGHRIAGPHLAILAFIDELKNGNYEYKRELRSHDELKEIMTALQELAPILKDRETGD